MYCCCYQQSLELSCDGPLQLMATERRDGSRAVGVGGGGGEGKRTASAAGEYFTAELAVLFFCLTAMLVFLPLVLPPLPPPPSLLLLVPVGIMAVLLALAFAPSDGRSSVAASCLQ